MRIVIVEDEAAIREGMVKLLHQINPQYEVVGKAVDGQSGYELIRSVRPDLIIVDIRMPDMNGLAMIRKLQEEQVRCKVLVISAYSEFEYAREAIELGIINYLLKPLKISELKKALDKVDQEIRRDQHKEYGFSLENIFMGCINGQLKPDAYFHEQTREKYGFTVQEPAELFMVWLGNGYEAQKETAKGLLEHVADHTVKFAANIRELKGWEMLLMILYRQSGGESQLTYFEKSVVPMLCDNLKKPVVCVWRRIEQLLDMSRVLQEMRKDREWNLCSPDRTLIYREAIQKQQIVPVKYPLELEDRAKRALREKNWEELVLCYERLYEYLVQETHLPSQIKESLIRFNWSLVSTQKEKKEESELHIQKILQRIASADTWSQIKQGMVEFMGILDYSEPKLEEPSVSDLIHRAKVLIRKYYNQGITLEETARKLFVSEEYLSAQFKKETGNTFTETVRKYRIKKVKELLVETHLKMNQIAELAGYSDPKYMSRVFKEEVGMLPTEYRKEVQ